MEKEAKVTATITEKERDTFKIKCIKRKLTSQEALAKLIRAFNENKIAI